jgi:hypothetical protein
LPCFGQFSEIWTNGDLFKVNEMASQCYSASVERCVAAGVTPDSPSWYDYLLGKNHAKLVSVKENIKAVRPYFVSPSANVLSELTARDSAVWTNAVHFLSDCGLPTNALDETPWFKSQYASTTGGWIHVHAMLTNMVVSENAGSYTLTETNGYYYYGANELDALTWASSKQEAEDNWPIFSSPGSLGRGPLSASAGAAYNQPDAGTSYVAIAFTESQFLGYHVPSQSVSRSATLYHKAGPFIDSELTDDINSVLESATFTNNGASVSNGWYVAGTVTDTNALSIVGTRIGKLADSSNDPGLPLWCSEPSIPPVGLTNNVVTLGFETDGQRVILNWTATTNGFKYR